jgi:hypothetical protein
MPQVNWRMDFSFGNVLTIVTLLVGLVVGWQTLASTVEAHTATLDSLDTRLKQEETKFQQLLDAVQQDRVRQTEILTEVRTDIKYIRELQAAETKGPRK